MTDSDVIAVVMSLMLGLTLWFVKVALHFEYLKKEKGRFRHAPTLLYLVFRPFYLFDYLPEVFTILNVPVLWNLKTSRRRMSVGILSYVSLILVTFAIIYAVQRETTSV